MDTSTAVPAVSSPLRSSATAPASQNAASPPARNVSLPALTMVTRSLRDRSRAVSRTGTRPTTPASTASSTGPFVARGGRPVPGARITRSSVTTTRPGGTWAAPRLSRLPSGVTVMPGEARARPPSTSGRIAAASVPAPVGAAEAIPVSCCPGRRRTSRPIADGNQATARATTGSEPSLRSESAAVPEGKATTSPGLSTCSIPGKITSTGGGEAGPLESRKMCAPPLPRKPSAPASTTISPGPGKAASLSAAPGAMVR